MIFFVLPHVLFETGTGFGFMHLGLLGIHLRTTQSLIPQSPQETDREQFWEGRSKGRRTEQRLN